MDDLIDLSRRLGQNIIYVKGAGGNSSVKVKDKIIIKPSGKRMKELTLISEYSKCKYTPLLDYLNSKKKYKKSDEDNFIKLIDEVIIGNSLKPSMEIGLHAVLPSKYVFHLHSVYANIFLCMKNGSKILKNLFKGLDIMIVDYKNPGYELALYFSKINKIPEIIFLKNHGIIVHGDNITKIEKQIELIHLVIEVYLISKFNIKEYKTQKNYKKVNEYLFPDAAVFSTLNLKSLKAKKKEDILEIMSTQIYILNTIKKLKNSPTFLTQSQSKRLTDMTQEKMRLKI